MSEWQTGGSKSFSFVGGKIWEKVPEELKQCSLYQLKKVETRDVPQGKLLGLAEKRVFTTLLGRVRIRVSTTSKYELKTR